MVAAGQATEAGARRLAMATTVADQFFDIGFIAIYAGDLPNGNQIAPYVPGLIEAVAYFGVAGAILSVGIFFTFTGLFDVGSLYLRTSPSSIAICAKPAPITGGSSSSTAAGTVTACPKPEHSRS